MFTLTDLEELSPLAQVIVEFARETDDYEVSLRTAKNVLAFVLNGSVSGFVVTADDVSKTVTEVDDLHRKPKCPSCGYEPDENESLTVSDWNLARAKVRFDEGVLEDPDWNVSSSWKEKEKVTCPECGNSNPMKDWGLKWSWQD